MRARLPLGVPTAVSFVASLSSWPNTACALRSAASSTRLSRSMLARQGSSEARQAERRPGAARFPVSSCRFRGSPFVLRRDHLAAMRRKR